MFKRRRTSTGGSASNRRAIAAAIAIRRKFPYSQYGIAHMRRGTADNLGMFGADFRSANSSQRALRNSVGYYGKGSYWSDALGEAWGAAKAYGSGGEAGLGSYLGNRVAASPIWNAKSKMRADIRKATGMGAYNVNSLVNNRDPVGTMNTVNNETGDLVIKHREFITSIAPTSANFQSQGFFALQPGLSTTFPWLSQIAKYFEEYEFHQILFEYVSVVTGGNATAKGTVLMATLYNCSAAAYSAQQNMENSQFSNSGKVADDFVHGVECEPTKVGGNLREYIRTDTVAGADLNTYDHGNFQIATVGANPNEQIGNLYVTYTVKLSKPRVLVS